MTFQKVHQNLLNDIKDKCKKNKFNKHEGPHTVLKKINPVTYLTEIDKDGKKQAEKKHINKFKNIKIN